MRADELIELLGMRDLADATWPNLSQGERGRTLIARALQPDPHLLLLDEPSTGLDIAAREHLLDRIDGLRAQHPDLASVLVTHHLEELPASTTHALLLRDGRIVAQGAADDVLTSALISETLDYPLSSPAPTAAGRCAPRAEPLGSPSARAHTARSLRVAPQPRRTRWYVPHMTRIVAVAAGLPARSYSQAEITAALLAMITTDPGRQAVMRRIHASSGVETRNLVMPLEQYSSLASFRESNDYFIAEGTTLAERALADALGTRRARSRPMSTSCSSPRSPASPRRRSTPSSSRGWACAPT